MDVEQQVAGLEYTSGYDERQRLDFAPGPYTAGRNNQTDSVIGPGSVVLGTYRLEPGRWKSCKVIRTLFLIPDTKSNLIGKKISSSFQLIVNKPFMFWIGNLPCCGGCRCPWKPRSGYGHLRYIAAQGFHIADGFAAAGMVKPVLFLRGQAACRHSPLKSPDRRRKGMPKSPS